MTKEQADAATAEATRLEETLKALQRGTFRKQMTDLGIPPVKHKGREIHFANDTDEALWRARNAEQPDGEARDLAYAHLAKIDAFAGTTPAEGATARAELYRKLLKRVDDKIAAAKGDGPIEVAASQVARRQSDRVRARATIAAALGHRADIDEGRQALLNLLVKSGGIVQGESGSRPFDSVAAYVETEMGFEITEKGFVKQGKGKAARYLEVDGKRVKLFKPAGEDGSIVGWEDIADYGREENQAGGTEFAEGEYSSAETPDEFWRVRFEEELTDSASPTNQEVIHQHDEIDAVAEQMGREGFTEADIAGMSDAGGQKAIRNIRDALARGDDPLPAAEADAPAATAEDAIVETDAPAWRRGGGADTRGIRGCRRRRVYRANDAGSRQLFSGRGQARADENPAVD